MGDGENLLDDDELACGAFIGSNTTFHGGGNSNPISVDGVFQINQDVDPLSNSEDSDSEDEVENTYSSKGKRLRKQAGDKK